MVALGKAIASTCILAFTLSVGACGKTYNTTNHYHFYGGYGAGAENGKAANLQGPTVIMPSPAPTVFPPNPQYPPNPPYPPTQSPAIHVQEAGR